MSNSNPNLNRPNECEDNQTGGETPTAVPTGQKGPGWISSEVVWACSKVQQVSKFSERFIPTAAMVYAFGYFVWSYHAWQSNLGLLSPVNAQYFVAGIIPFLIALCAYWFSHRGQERIKDWLHKNFYALPKLSRWLIGLAGTAATLCCLWATIERFHSIGDGGRHVTLPDCVWALFTAYLVAMACQVVLPLFYEKQSWAPPERIVKRRRKALHFFHIYTTFLLPALIGIGAFSIYLRYIYPKVPQEMGGVKPRYAYVGLKVENFSDTQRAALLPLKLPKANNPKVIRSRKLTVYFANNDFMMVTPYVEPKSKWKRVRSSTYGVLKKILSINEPRPKVYEIRSDDRGVIEWVDIEEGSTGQKGAKAKKPHSSLIRRSSGKVLVGGGRK